MLGLQDLKQMQAMSNVSFAPYGFIVEGINQRVGSSHHRWIFDRSCGWSLAGFKTVAGAASCSWVGSTPTRSRQLNGLLNGRSVLAQRWFRYSCLRSFYGSFYGSFLRRGFDLRVGRLATGHPFHVCRRCASDSLPDIAWPAWRPTACPASERPVEAYRVVGARGLGQSLDGYRLHAVRGGREPSA